MLSSFTNYLLQYRKLCIPNLGTFELVQQTPAFNVVDKLVTPPAFQIRHEHRECVSDHQVAFLSSTIEGSSAAVQQKMYITGEKIRKLAESGPFHWNGIGIIRSENGKVLFENTFQAVGLEPVPAHRVLRENVEHRRIVGDREISTSSVTSSGLKKNSFVLKIGLIVLILALILIVFLLYRAGFNPLGTGLRWRINGDGY